MPQALLKAGRQSQLLTAPRRAIEHDAELELVRPRPKATKVYSASEALLPALRRTHAYLFHSFEWETFLKLAFVGLLCEGFLVSFRFMVPSAMLDINATALKALLLARDFLPVTILGGIAIILTGIYGLYLLTSLRFGFFHSLIHQTQKIRKACQLYSVEADRLFAASVVIWGSLSIAVMLLVALVVVAGYTVASSPTSDGKLDPGNFLILFFPCIGFAFALLLAICAAHVILNDFILPHMAVEGATFKKAWAEVRTRIAGNKETFFSFFLLRMGIPIFAGIVLVLFAWLVGLAVFGLLDMSSAGFNAMLDGVPGIRSYVLYVIHILFQLLGLGAGLAIAAIFGGPLGVFIRSYSLFYYGGHFKALGNLLEPPNV